MGLHLAMKQPVQTYTLLDQNGYDQVPTASNHSSDENFGLTVDYCTKHIQNKHLVGFLQTPWRPTIEEYRQHHLDAIGQVGEEIMNEK